MSDTVPSILHVHSTFDPGGKEVRNVRLINMWGGQAHHAIVSGDLERRGAAALLSPKVKVSWPRFPSLNGGLSLKRLKALGAAMAGYDLICTYNWGAMDAVMAHTLFADMFKLAPLVHHEDGFNEDEAGGLKKRRNWYRRIALGRSGALVVPSKTLERIALETWVQPRARVRRIANGIDTRAFAAPVSRDVLPGLIKRKDEFWIGSLAGLRAVKNLDALIRVMPRLEPDWHLVIAGEGPERAHLEQLAIDLKVEDRVHLPGFVKDPAKLVGLFDLFALSSHSEQFPISMVEAMAAGLPVVAPRVGDIPDMVASDNGPLLYSPGDEEELFNILWRITGLPKEMKRIGQANRTKARAEFDQQGMSDRYRALYWGLMGRNRPAPAEG